MATSFTGEVVAEIIEVRFAFSGKVVSVRKKQGDLIKKWESIASLDRKILQIELDRQLADYEKTRADFEIFGIKNSTDNNDITKFLRQEKQAALNASVKEVELAKYRMDQADLLSPVAGTILSTEGLVPGLHVTPASNPVKIIDSGSLRFEFTVTQSELYRFLLPTEIIVVIHSAEKEVIGTTIPPFTGRNGTFTISAGLNDSAGLIPGMKGKISLKS